MKFSIDSRTKVLSLCICDDSNQDEQCLTTINNGDHEINLKIVEIDRNVFHLNFIPPTPSTINKTKS